MIKSYFLDGYIIKRKNYGEADKLVTVFSRQIGKLSLKAKGIRKINSRRAGTLELFNLVHMQVVKGRGDMDVITETVLTKDFSILGKELYRAKTAYELIELLNTFAPEQIENDPLFELMCNAFEYISSDVFKSSLSDKTSLRFKQRMLELMGYGLHVDPSHNSLNTIIESISERKLVAHHMLK